MTQYLTKRIVLPFTAKVHGATVYQADDASGTNPVLKQVGSTVASTKYVRAADPTRFTRLDFTQTAQVQDHPSTNDATKNVQEFRAGVQDAVAWTLVSALNWVPVIAEGAVNIPSGQIGPM